MQSHLCPAMDPLLVQPHITRPLPPTSSAFQVCPDQTPMLLSTQLTLLLQPFSDPSSHSGSSSRSSDREQASSAPINTSSSSPYSLSIQLCWLCGVLSHPVCLYTLVPLSRAREQCPGHRRKAEGGPTIPSFSSRGRPCPLSSHSPQWVHLTIYESPCHP